MGITRMMMKRAITGITMPHRNPIWLRVRRLAHAHGHPAALCRCLSHFPLRIIKCEI